MNWSFRIRQIWAVTRLELKRFMLARRWVGLYVLAFAPVFILLVRSRIRADRMQTLDDLSLQYANLFRFFELQFGLFMSCAAVFSQLFRGDILEKTLHLYLLTPARREVITIGKYLAGVIFVVLLYGTSTTATHVLTYWSTRYFPSFFFEGPGLLHLAQYILIMAVGSIVYGAIFLLVSLLFKNPGVATAFLFAWESLSFAFPPLLQKLSVMYYLQALLPVTVDHGPFAVLADNTPPIIGIPLVVLAAAAFLASAGWLVRYTQITYSAD